MIKKIFAFIFLLCFLVAPITVSAQFGKAGVNLKTVAGGTGLTSSFEGSISTIITGVLSLAGTVFLVLTVYAGILWMTAAGSEEKVTKAKDIVTQAIIGLAITLGAYAITAFVTGRLTSGSSNTQNPPSSNSELVGSKNSCSDGSAGATKSGWCFDPTKSVNTSVNCAKVTSPGANECNAGEQCCF